MTRDASPDVTPVIIACVFMGLFSGGLKFSTRVLNFGRKVFKPFRKLGSALKNINVKSVYDPMYGTTQKVFKWGKNAGRLVTDVAAEAARFGGKAGRGLVRWGTVLKASVVAGGAYVAYWFLDGGLVSLVSDLFGVSSSTARWIIAAVILLIVLLVLWALLRRLSGGKGGYRDGR